MDKGTPAELLEERVKRIEAASRLQVPDRVPISASFDYFPARYVTGVTCEDAFYNPRKWIEACKKTMVDFAPDAAYLELPIGGPVLDALDSKQLLLPGHGVSRYHSHQFVEDEYMKADEWGLFLTDPGDFSIRKFLPRIYGKLAALNKLPPLSDLVAGGGLMGVVEMFTEPEFHEVLRAIYKAGEETRKWLSSVITFNDELEALGFPPYSASITMAPYDILPDLLRGMKGSMLDLYRRPDEVLEACDKILPMMVEHGIEMAKGSKNKRVFIPLHRGSEGFMSPGQFEKFYWPTLKKLMLAIIDAGLTPVPFFEGDYTSRLEYLLELPEGKVVGHFDTTDLFRAKDVIGSHICIQGNIPSSLLQTGSPEDVKDYTRKLIDGVGKNGGYIMCSRSTLDEASPELVKIWIDYTKEYGVY